MCFCLFVCFYFMVLVFFPFYHLLVLFHRFCVLSTHTHPHPPTFFLFFFLFLHHLCMFHSISLSPCFLFHRLRVLSVLPSPCSISPCPCSFYNTVSVFFLFYRPRVFLSMSPSICVLSMSPSLCSVILFRRLRVLFHRLRVLSFFIVSVFFLFSSSPCSFYFHRFRVLSIFTVSSLLLLCFVLFCFLFQRLRVLSILRFHRLRVFSIKVSIKTKPFG